MRPFLCDLITLKTSLNITADGEMLDFMHSLLNPAVAWWTLLLRMKTIIQRRITLLHLIASQQVRLRCIDDGRADGGFLLNDYNQTFLHFFVREVSYAEIPGASLDVQGRSWKADLNMKKAYNSVLDIMCPNHQLYNPDISISLQCSFVHCYLTALNSHRDQGGLSLFNRNCHDSGGDGQFWWTLLPCALIPERGFTWHWSVSGWTCVWH